MKPSEFQYHAPTTVDEAVQLLGTLEDARLLAGGQSLMPMMNCQMHQSPRRPAPGPAYICQAFRSASTTVCR